MRWLLLLLPLFLFFACTDPPPEAHFSPPNFSKSPPLRLDVGAVNITESYRTSSQPPHVEGLFSTTPAEAMRDWVRDRVRPVGGPNTLVVTIKDASVTAAQSGDGKRYDARLEVEMRIYGPDQPMSLASLNVVATRSDTLPGTASAAERDALFDRMTHELMNVANAELEKDFYSYFSGYLRYE